MGNDKAADYIFRKATADDAEQLAALAYELNLYHGEDMKPDPESIKRDWGRFEAYVVEHKGTLLGFLSGYENYQFHATTIRFEIQNLHVKETERRKGIGKILFEGVIRRKYGEGIRKFSLGVMMDNRAARAFYEAFGFEERPRDNLRYVLMGDRLEKIINRN